jgi:uncharacterized membrane protein YphA (DoxX/SURF4 family)
MESRAKVVGYRLALVAVSGVFIYAGVVKATDPAAFARDIGHYQLTPWPVTVALALYIPWLEILAGLGLCFRTWRPAAGAILIGLTLVFIGALVSAWARGLDISCGCFGSRVETANYPMWLARDVALLMALRFCAVEASRNE